MSFCAPFSVIFSVILHNVFYICFYFSVINGKLVFFHENVHIAHVLMFVLGNLKWSSILEAFGRSWS